MGEYTGGYTSAVNDQSARTAADFTNQHLAQLIAARAFASQQEQQAQARAAQGRTNAGVLLPALFQAAAAAAPPAGPVGAPFSPPVIGPPPGAPVTAAEDSGAMGQPPAPGQASMPGAPPMGALGGFSSPDSMRPGAPQGAGAVDPSLAAASPSEPQAAPMPAGWQPSPAAGPELGGQPQQQMQGADSGVGAPPPLPKIPPQLLSVPNLIKAMQDRKIPPEQMVDTLKQLEPLIASENRFAVAEFKAQTDAAKAANAAYNAAINKFKAENAYRDTSSKITRREASATNAADVTQIRREALDARLTGRTPGGTAPAGLPPPTFNFTADVTPEGKAAALRDAANPAPEQNPVAGAAPAAPAGINPETVDFYAKQSIAGDNSWQVGLARGRVGQQLIAAVKDRIPAIAKELDLSPQEVGSNKAANVALSSALRDRTKFVAAGQQFVRNMQAQTDLVEKYMDKGLAGGVPALNKWIQAGRVAIAGDPDVSALDTAMRGLAREHQRIVTGVTSNAQLHVAAQHTADELLNRAQSPAQVRAVLKVMREEADNAISAGQQEADALKTRLANLGKGKSSSTAGTPPAAPSGAPRRISGDAEYDALPKGATFIGPDGKARIKP